MYRYSEVAAGRTVRLSIGQWSVDSAQWSQCLVSAYLSGARGAGREQARRRTGESIAKQAAVTSSSSAWNRSSREASCTAAHLRAGAYSREQAARRKYARCVRDGAMGAGGAALQGGVRGTRVVGRACSMRTPQARRTLEAARRAARRAAAAATRTSHAQPRSSEEGSNRRRTRR